MSSSETPNRAALVIGIGNSLRRDDGAGRAVADALDAPDALNGLNARHGGARVLSLMQLVPELAEEISQARLVVFVDAAIDLPPGQISWRPLAPSAADVHAHRLDPPALLRLAQVLYGQAPAAWLVSIGGQEWGLGETLSPVVQQAVRKVVMELPARLD